MSGTGIDLDTNTDIDRYPSLFHRGPRGKNIVINLGKRHHHLIPNYTDISVKDIETEALGFKMFK